MKPLLPALALLLATSALSAQPLQVTVDNGAGTGIRLDGVTATYEPPVESTVGRGHSGLVLIAGQLREVAGLPVEGIELLVDLEDPLVDNSRRATVTYRSIPAGGTVSIERELEAPVPNYRVTVRPIRIKRPGEAKPKIILPQNAPAVPVQMESAVVGSVSALWDEPTRRLRLDLTASLPPTIAALDLVVKTYGRFGDATGEVKTSVDAGGAMQVDVTVPERPSSVRLEVVGVRFTSGRLGRDVAVEARSSPDVEVLDVKASCDLERCLARYRVAAVTGRRPVAAEVEIALFDAFGDEIRRDRSRYFALPAVEEAQDFPAATWRVLVSVQRVRLENGQIWTRPVLGIKPDRIQED